MNQEVKALLADTDKVLIGIGESFERKDEQFNTDAFRMLEKENPLLNVSDIGRIILRTKW